jgi:hypothetical protein
MTSEHGPFDRTRRLFVIEEATAILARTPATLDALLRGLPDGWIAAHEGGQTWSPYDVVGHLIHGEQTDWMPRLRIILEHGESRRSRNSIVWRNSPHHTVERCPNCSTRSRACVAIISPTWPRCGCRLPTSIAVAAIRSLAW